MRWNAFELISPALSKTKERIFPFNFKEWFKLGIAATISGNLSGNFNISNFGNIGENWDKENVSSNITGAASRLRENAAPIGGLIAVIFVLFTIWSYISNVFKFIFIESVLEKKTKYNFRKNMSKGTSLFLFNFVITISVLIVLAIIFLPFIKTWLNGDSIIDSLGWGSIILSILLTIIFVGIIGFLLLFVKDFVTAYMYFNNIGAYPSWKQVWKIISKNKVETLVYWVARLTISLVNAIIGLLILFVALVVFLIIGGVIALIGYLIYLVIGAGSLLIGIGIILAIGLIIILILTIITVAMPIAVFTKYFSLLNFEKLTKIKLTKRR